MRYCKSYRPSTGLSTVVKRGDGGLQLTAFGLLDLKQGQSHTGESGDCELVFIVLGGVCSIRGDGFVFAQVGGRRDVFDGKPHTVYIPRATRYTVTAESDVELAWTSAPSDLDTQAYVIEPSSVKGARIGKENYQRDARLVLTDAFPSRHFFIGEAIVPSGNHASYPPHRHDADNLPVEVDMEEIYFFRFKPQQGYGIQRLYTDDRSIDYTCTVRHNDVTLLPRGYHPVINTPGYTLYYLWVMAGEVNRKFLSVVDPEHQWLT